MQNICQALSADKKIWLTFKKLVLKNLHQMALVI